MLAIAGAAAQLTGGTLQAFSSRDPGSESERARAQLAHHTRAEPDFQLVVLLRLPAGERRTGTANRVRALAAALRSDRDVASVTLPAPGGPLVAKNGRSVLLVAALRDGPRARQLDAARRLTDRFAGQPDVRVGGKAAFYANGNDIARSDLLRSEVYALAGLLLLSVIFFRGVTAAACALATALFTTGLTFAVLGLLADLVEISTYARNVVSGLGLGLAVDYSLLLISRVREEAGADGYGRPALERALDRAGRTITISALIVALAGASLWAFPQPLLRSIGAAICLVVIVACAAALVPLAAALLLLGERVNALAPRRWRASLADGDRPAVRGAWYRLARAVQRRPLPWMLGALFVLLALATPALGLKITQVDAPVVPPRSPDRQVIEAVARDFPAPNALAPIYLSVSAPHDAATSRRLATLIAGLRGLPDAQSVGGARPVAPDLWRVDVVSRGDVLGAAARRLVVQVRVHARRAPGATLVGGETAQLVDLRSSLWAHAGWALALLLVATFAPLALATGSLWLPFKTLIMNALTVLAAVGVLVFVFQDGRMAGLLGYTSSGALEPVTLIAVAAVALALATDYGVFLLTRVKEFRDQGLDDTEAVALGQQRTGRIVSQAALLLCVALLSLLAAHHALVKEVGVGCAVAVAVDALLVRAVLVPSLMQLLGPRLNWWPGRHSR